MLVHTHQARSFERMLRAFGLHAREKGFIWSFSSLASSPSSLLPHTRTRLPSQGANRLVP